MAASLLSSELARTFVLVFKRAACAPVHFSAAFVHSKASGSTSRPSWVGKNVVPACTSAPVNEEGIVPWVVGVGEEIEVHFFERCGLFG